MQSEPHAPRLLADIGGTNARFAWQACSGAALEAQATLACSDYATLELAMQAYLERVQRPRPVQAAIAIANPVYGDRVQMTNHHWSFSIAALRQRMGLQRLEVLNDFVALALALPDLLVGEKRLLKSCELKPGSGIQGNSESPSGPLALIGPGTGLGVSGLLPMPQGGWLPIAGEGGHVTLAACNPREQRMLEALKQRYGHVSAERAISGGGLVDLYQVLCCADSCSPNDWTAAQISAAALQGHPQAREALELFCAFLGTVAGNLALTMGARGGLYIGGGIVPKLGAFFDQSPFLERFIAKGRFRAYLETIPVWVIVAEQSPALRGAARVLERV